eukprot:TRINITY_DN38116_c0_g1_i1.p1 TRINITY_DN38116_c0_g1~~TRINITY_DN38116_c0_g1_i1.p1  ORF type:complete len:508 (-),score=69.04 TRINITY_DN38116_c0_g1_i1:287-1810(-)
MPMQHQPRQPPPRGSGGRGVRSPATPGERKQLRGEAASGPGDTGGASHADAPYGTVKNAAPPEKPEEPPTSPKSLAEWVSDWLRWLETSEKTDPGLLLSYWCEEFKPRKLKAPMVLAWLLVQSLGLFFQFMLLAEVSTHLSNYETTLSIYCGPEHQQHGVCLGPAWNMSYSGTLTFPPSVGDDSQSDFDFVIPSDQPFSFEIHSQPPTFLVGIEPLPPLPKASWKLALGPHSGGSGGQQPLMGSGSRYKVFTDRQRYGTDANRWSASMSLRSKQPESVQIHAYVVDSRLQHLEDIHKQDQCRFDESWQNFNERHSGQHHSVLTNVQTAITAFIVASMLLGGVVLHRFFFYIDGGKLVSRIIAIKFLLQDMPQQLCIVAYLYAWFADNGLRCQMCLFHPTHCDDQYPLHSTNLLLCIFTMLSASANQLLVQAKMRRYRDEEDECFMWIIRAAMLSVSILPFCTAVFVLSSTVLHLRSPFIYFIFGLPTVLGWGALVCVPAFVCCDDDD